MHSHILDFMCGMLGLFDLFLFDLNRVPSFKGCEFIISSQYITCTKQQTNLNFKKKCQLVHNNSS